MGKKKKFGFSWSWKRALGISSTKGKISRKIGIPLTKSGRQKKIGRGLGCCVILFIFFSLFLTVIASAVWLIF